MNTLIILTAVVCAVFVTFASADEEENCKSYFKEMKKKSKEIVEGKDAPECVKKFDLAQFQCQEGDDHEKKKEHMKKFHDFVKDKTSDEKTEIANCFDELYKLVVPNVEGPDECKEKAEKMHNMIKKKLTKE